MKSKNYVFLMLIAFGFSSFKASTQTISTYAGNGTAGYSGSGPATAEEIDNPLGIAIDANGNIYIADWGSNRIRKVDNTGTITTVVGTGTFGWSGDGGPATAAEITKPDAICFDANNNMYICDNGDMVIRKINTSGIITTLAGQGFQPGYTGNGGPATAAKLNGPWGITCDASGNVYFADQTNNVIRKVDVTGKIKNFAGNGYQAGTGNGGYSGDGGIATSAELWQPEGITFDNSGNLLISDTYNNVIREVNTSGIITTVMGNHIAGYSGDGGQATAAELHYPSGIAFDAYGFLFIADFTNNVVREVDAAGKITTQAGNDVLGYSGDGGPATAAELNGPQGVVFDVAANLYVVDRNNNRIRMVNSPVGFAQLHNTNDVIICPNPSNGIFSIKSNTIKTTSIFEVYNMLGEKVYSGSINDGFAQINLSGNAKGIYVCSLLTLNREPIAVQKIVIE